MWVWSCDFVFLKSHDHIAYETTCDLLPGCVAGDPIIRLKYEGGRYSIGRYQGDGIEGRWRRKVFAIDWCC